MPTVISTYNLEKRDKNKIILDSVNFTLEEGDICGLIGKNGAGKSTFLKMLSGQSMPSSGEIQYFETANSETARRRIAFLIEEPSFITDFSAEQNLEYFRIQLGIAEPTKVDEVLKIVGLTDQKNKRVKAYSMGMKQRLGLALCLLSNPDCLVLDEPINGLDPEAINEIRQLLMKLNQENQITILISSNILEELHMVAKRFVFLSEGKIVDDISNTDLQESCKEQLKIKTDNSEKTAQLLEQGYSDISYKCLPNGKIRIFNHFNDCGDINRLLVNNGIDVTEFYIEDTKLENYFLQVIGGMKND